MSSASDQVLSGAPRREVTRRTVSVVALLFIGMVGSLVVHARTVDAQAIPLPNEDIVPCSFTAGDPYEMNLDICRAWGRLQNLAIDRVEDIHGLVDDRSLTLTRARTQVQAMLWSIVNDAALKPAGSRSRDERLVVDWLAGLTREHGIDVAERALAMHDAFYADERPGPNSLPCTFTPPFPYQNQYPGENQSRESFCFAGYFPDVFGIGVTNKPESEEWIRWATADVMRPKFTEASGLLARAVAAQLGLLGAMAAASAAAIFFTTLVITQVLVISAGVASNIATGLALVGGIGIAGFASLGAVIAVLAVISAIYGTIVLFQDERPELVAALAEAQKTIDLGELFSRPGGLDLAFTLFTGWLSTAPSPPVPAPVPARVPSDPRFTVTPLAGGPTSGVVDSFTINDGGIDRTVTMQGGYWVITDVNGTTVTTDLPGFDRQGRVGTVKRSRLADGSFGFVAAGPSTVCAGTTDCEPQRDFLVTGAGGFGARIRYAGTQGGQDLPPLTFDFDKVSTASIGVPASFFVAVFDTAGTRVSATYTWEIGNRCLTVYSTGCEIDITGAPKAPDGSLIAVAGTGQSLSYAFPTSGRWWMRVKATTAAGDTYSNWFTVDVGNPAPSLSIVSPVNGQVLCSTTGNTTCPATVVGPFGVGVNGVITDAGVQYELETVTIDWGDGSVEFGDSGRDFTFCPRPGPNGTTTFIRCVNFGSPDGNNLAFSASKLPAPGVYGNRTMRVTVRDVGGNQASLTVPYTIPDTRQVQTVEIDTAPPTPWGTPIPLNASASSDLPLEFSATPENWCVVDNGMLIGARAGECTVRATQAGNETFQPATTTRTFTFTSRPSTIAFAPPAEVVLPTDPAARLAISATASDAQGAAPPGTVVVISSTPDVCTVSGLQVQLLSLGSCSLVAAIPGSNTNWTAPWVVRTIRVVTMPKLPGTPTGVTTSSTRANTVSVSFVPVPNDEGGSINSYRAVCSTGDPAQNRSASGTGSPLVVSGLITGLTYRCRVSATNLAGTGPASLPSAAFAVTGAPASPLGVTAVAAGSGRVTVSFVAPTADGGSPITGFAAVCSSATGVTRRATGTASPITVTSLTAGAEYSCVAHAINAFGSSLPSDTSEPVLVQAVPGAPTAILASPSTAGRALVSFFAPDSDGGSPITGYRALCTSPTGQPRSGAGTSSPIEVTALTTGATYRCFVTATNAVGTSVSSVQSDPFDAVGLPSAPTGVSVAAAGSGQLRVSFTPPESDGGAPLSGFAAVCSSPTGVARRVAGGGSPITVSALTGGATYTCVAHAITSAGTSAPSAPSSALLVRSVPGVPTNVVATSTGSTRASVSVGRPVSDGGAAIMGYSVLCTSPTGVSRSANATTSPITVTGLTAGAAYTCRASATNSIGTGTASAAVPIGPPIPV